MLTIDATFRFTVVGVAGKPKLTRAAATKIGCGGWIVTAADAVRLWSSLWMAVTVTVGEAAYRCGVMDALYQGAREGKWAEPRREMMPGK